MNNRALMGALLAGMLVTGGAGIAIGSQLRSPADVAADAKAPDRSPVTAQVQRKRLSSTVTTRGTLRFSEPRPVSLAGPVGSSSSSGASSIVTSIAERDTLIEEGDVALTVSGRPVIALNGTLPMYRQIKVGDSGDDVRQIEAALARLGFNPGAQDGVADQTFMSAIAAMYAARGHTAQGLTDQQKQELRTLENAVREAEQSLSSARAALDQATKPPSRIEYARADAAVQSAVDALNAARRRAETEAAEAEANVALRQAAVSDAQSALTRANAEVQTATTNLQAAQALVPADPAAVAQASEALNTANDRLASANSTLREAQAQLTSAQRARTQVKPTNDEAIRQATAAVSIAQAERAALDAPRDRRSADEQVDAATRSLNAARAAVSSFAGANTLSVPAGEIMLIPSLPLRVQEVKLKVGDSASGVVFTLSSTTLAVDSSIPTADRGSVKQGDKVTVEASEFGVETQGTVSFVDSVPATNGVGEGRVYMTISLDDPELAKDLAGASVRIRIPISATDGEVLVVPVSAIVTAPDGSTTVTLLRDGAQVVVPVRTGLSAGGDVEITPTAGSIDVGDRVIVDEKAVKANETQGRQQGSGASTNTSTSTSSSVVQP